MSIKDIKLSRVLFFLWFVSVGVAIAAPLGTAFTYEGRLTENGQPAQGSFEMRFGVYNAPTGGVLIGSWVTNAVQVNGGLFRVDLDFGPGGFNGDARWLDIGARSNQSTGAFTQLEPRQRVAPAPYALHSVQADQLSGPLASAQFLNQIGQSGIPSIDRVSPSDRLLAFAGTGASGGQSGWLSASNLASGLFGKGKIIYVDSLSGNDATAVKGNPALPWASVSNAVAAASDGDTVLINPGRYVLVGGRPGTCTPRTNVAAVNLAGRSYVSIIGVGMPVLYWSSYGDGLNIYACDNVRVSGLTFESVRYQDGSIASNGLASAITLRNGSRNITIDHCNFFNLPNHGISCGDSRDTTNVFVTECHFDLLTFTYGVPYLMYDGAAISGVGSRWIIANNVFDRCLRGVELENGEWFFPPVKNVLIHGNQFRRIGFEGVSIMPNPISTISDVVVSDNTYYEPEPVFNWGSFFLAAYGGHRIKISGNRISGGLTHLYGIYLAANVDSSDCMITDNFIEGGKRHGITVIENPNDRWPAILTNCLIAGNYCIGQGEAGVYVSASGCTVANNYLVGAGALAPGSGGAIVLTNEFSSCDGNKIIQNFLQPDPKCGTAIAINGQSVTNNFIAGNFTMGKVRATSAGLNTMGANWTGNGELSSANPVKSLTANYVVAPSDHTLLIKAGGLRVTLPPAAANTAHPYIFKQTAAGASVITNATGAETIDGVLSTNLTGKNRVIALQSDGTNWQILWSQ